MEKYIKPELIIVETEMQQLMAGSINYDPSGETHEALVPGYGEFDEDIYE
ncbi:MAG: hypothetical protein ACI4V5_01070 [Prevotella sp.]